MQKFVVPSAAAALLCSIAAPLQAQTIVTSLPEWNGTDGVLLIALPGGYSTLGQTFTVPGGGNTTLDTVRTQLDLGPSSNNGIRAYIYAMSGNQTVGAPIFRSDPIADPGLPNGTFSPVAFGGINADLAAGQTYVLLFSNAEGNSSAFQNTSFASTGSAGSASPLLGNVVFSSSLSSPGLGQLTGLTLNPSSTPSIASRDLAIELTFIPAPAPVSALALGALALVRPSRRR